MFKKVKGLCDWLIETTPETIENINKLDAEGYYNEHLDPIDPNMIEPVGDNYPYIKKPLGMAIRYWLLYHLLVRPMEKRELKRMGFKVVGRENLNGINSAIITSNHVNKLDCSLNREALKGHKVYITAGTFNNMKGMLGDIMRCSRMMPMSETSAGMKHFTKSINTLLKGNNYVLFYPERAEWWCYKKPRPMMDGAFHFAAKNNVPVIPSFITFTPNGKKCASGVDMYDMTVNILAPIYPKEGLNNKEQVKYLKEENARAWKECYEKTYGIPLVMNEPKFRDDDLAFKK
ncbi:MAG: 1-acyl-sn-glycerol-3-phosphate acyltransferase [Acholeplasmatales bacterium]|nr:1-acyl-sn-glycerol-3-phosphate acyltransferase [Acholeplasmatales bacterium]